jgi:hypothetical protein
MNVDELGPEEFRVAFTQEEHATFDERAPEREVMLPLSRMTPMQAFAAFRRAEVEADELPSRESAGRVARLMTVVWQAMPEWRDGTVSIGDALHRFWPGGRARA